MKDTQDNAQIAGAAAIVRWFKDIAAAKPTAINGYKIKLWEQLEEKLATLLASSREEGARAAIRELASDEEIGAAWDADRKAMAYDPRSPREAFWAGALFGISRSKAAGQVPRIDTSESAVQQGVPSVHVNLGPMALEFSSHQQWVNKAQSWFRRLAGENRNAAQKRYLAIDASGQVCMIGRDFARARDEKTFPVRVYLIDQGCAEAEGQ